MNLLRKLSRLLDRVFGERVPEGIDPKFWATRHDRLHNQPFDDRYEWRGHLIRKMR